jgi:GMP synthase (glutamine-hydrolysing)
MSKSISKSLFKSLSKILIVNSAEKGIAEFVEPIHSILDTSGHTYDSIEYSDLSITDVTRYFGVIISGSPRGDDIVDHHLPYFQWLKDCKVPVFGFCAGHHITGVLYGASLIRDIEKEVGDFPIYIDRTDPIFRGFQETITVRQNHHDSITLPEPFVLLAHSDRCSVSMMRHSTYPIYTSQFHPEILNPQMIVNFVEIAAAFRSGR